MDVINFDFTMRIAGSVPCGIPEHPFGDIRADEGEYFFRHAGLHPRMTYPVIVKGDSMQDAGLFDGDVVFVDCSREAQDRDIVLAALNGEHTIKRLRIHVNVWSGGLSGNGQSAGRIELVAENKRYQPIVIGEGDDIVVLGVVAGHYRRLG